MSLDNNARYSVSAEGEATGNIQGFPPERERQHEEDPFGFSAPVAESYHSSASALVAPEGSLPKRFLQEMRPQQATLDHQQPTGRQPIPELPTLQQGRPPTTPQPVPQPSGVQRAGEPNEHNVTNEETPLLVNDDGRNAVAGDDRVDDDITGQSQRFGRKGLCALLCSIGFICFIPCVIFLGIFGHQFTTAHMASSTNDIRQNDIIILPTGDNYCVLAKNYKSFSISEFPMYSQPVQAYIHEGDRNSIHNHSSSITTRVPRAILTTGLSIYNFYAASHANVAFTARILNVSTSRGFSFEEISLNLYVLGSIAELVCFENNNSPNDCHYIKSLPLNAKNDSYSLADYQTTVPGYYFLYLLAENAELTVAYNYTIRYDTFDSDDFDEPVCTIKLGTECGSIAIEQYEGTVCLLAYALPSASGYFTLEVQQVHRAEEFDNVSVAFLVLGAICLICTVFLVLIGSVLIGYGCVTNDGG